MRESERRFRNLADSLPVMMWAAGTDRHCTFFNSRWLEFTGCTRVDELRHGWTAHIHPADVAGCIAAYENCFELREEFHIECRLRRADGEYRWMLAAGAPLFSDGAFDGYVGTCIDIGDVRLVRRQSLLHKKLETVGVLAGGIAHDFNNLLASILADAELALAELPPGSASGEDVERIRTVAIRASEIVRELMVYAGQDNGQMTDVDLSLLVEEMLGLLKVSISKRAKLRTDLVSNPPAIYAEAAELRQMVMNVILNASEAVSATGGEIHVATSRVIVSPSESGPELVAGEYVRLEVSDNGCGIAREAQARIFEPYFTTKRFGTGLGLSVVRRILRRYHGVIKCQSTPGKGTRFEVLLPCARGLDGGRRFAALATSRIQPLEAQANLLIVEDEESLRLPISNLLRRAGFRVIESADGSTAIELLRKNEPMVDAMLLDLTLPGMSGEDVVVEVGRIRPDVKIVLTSAYGSQAADRALAARQVKGFVRKPYEFRELMRVLREVLTGSQAEFTRTAAP